MLHGFGDPREHDQARSVVWILAGELVRATSPDSSAPDTLGLDPVRAAALRSVIRKFLDSEDHTIDTPAERELMESIIEGALRLARLATEQLGAFRKILARAESLKLAAGSDSAQKPH